MELFNIFNRSNTKRQHIYKRVDAATKQNDDNSNVIPYPGVTGGVVECHPCLLPQCLPVTILFTQPRVVLPPEHVPGGDPPMFTDVGVVALADPTSLRRALCLRETSSHSHSHEGDDGQNNNTEQSEEGDDGPLGQTEGWNQEGCSLLFST